MSQQISLTNLLSTFLHRVANWFTSQKQASHSVDQIPPKRLGPVLGISLLVVLAALAGTVRADLFTVTSLGDTESFGTLRWAITQAVENPGEDLIVFEAGLSGTIQLTSELPIVGGFDRTTIIGGGESEGWPIAINGQETNFGLQMNYTTVLGLEFQDCDTAILMGHSCEVINNLFTGWIGIGILASQSIESNIQGNEIHFLGRGVLGVGCYRVWIRDNQFIGHPYPLTGTYAAVELDEDAVNNFVMDNYISLGGSGTSAETYGIFINAPWYLNGYTQIQGNIIGLTLDGLGLASARPDVGIYLHDAESVWVGRNNCIAGCGEANIKIDGNSSNNTVNGNKIGTNLAGMLALGGAVGILVTDGSHHNTILYNLVSGNSEDGIVLSDCYTNRVHNNTIGIASDGVSPLPNGGRGIVLKGTAQYNEIGGETPEEETPNTIGYNGCGIALQIPANQNRIDGNIILECDTGILIHQAWDNYITENEIDEFAVHGISCYEAGHNYILDNVITTTNDEDPFSQIGIHLELSQLNEVRGNLITGGAPRGSGNLGAGIALEHSANNKLGDNLIGYDSHDGVALATTSFLYGIRLISSDGNHIGHRDPAEGIFRNFVAGCYYGIYAELSSNNDISYNRIGTNKAGDAAMGNNRGVEIWGGDHNTLEFNTISGNGGRSIYLHETEYNDIIRNYIGTDAGLSAGPWQWRWYAAVGFKVQYHSREQHFT